MKAGVAALGHAEAAERSRHLGYEKVVLSPATARDLGYAVPGDETAVKVSSDAMQVMGAQGYMKEHPLERHYRDARQLMIVEGTSQIQRVIISRSILDGDFGYEY